MRYCAYCKASIQSERTHVWEARDKNLNAEILDLHTYCVANWLKRKMGWTLSFIKSID